MVSLTKLFQTPIYKRRSSATPRRCIHENNWDSRFAYSHRDPEHIADCRAVSPVLGSKDSLPRGRFGNISVPCKDRSRSKIGQDSYSKISSDNSYLDDLKSKIFLTDIKNSDEVFETSIDVGKVSPSRTKYVDSPMLHPGAVKLNRPSKVRTSVSLNRPETKLLKVEEEKDIDNILKRHNDSCTHIRSRPATSQESTSRPNTAMNLTHKQGAMKNRMFFRARTAPDKSSTSQLKSQINLGFPQVHSFSPIDRCYT